MTARDRARRAWGMAPRLVEKFGLVETADGLLQTPGGFLLDPHEHGLPKQAPSTIVCGVMLNPSVASGEGNDPTMGRWHGFMRDWYGIQAVRQYARDSVPRQAGTTYRFQIRDRWRTLLGSYELRIVNLFPYRTASPAKLWEAADAGIDIECASLNDEHITSAARDATIVIAAWGAQKRARARAERVRELLVDVRAGKSELMCLRKTKEGCPEHPLYLPKLCTPFSWR
jgi:hypothetical protein